MGTNAGFFHYLGLFFGAYRSTRIKVTSLTLRPRSVSLTLETKGIGLTLRPRLVSLTLGSR